MWVLELKRLQGLFFLFLTFNDDNGQPEVNFCFFHVIMIIRKRTLILTNKKGDRKK